MLPLAGRCARLGPLPGAGLVPTWTPVLMPVLVRPGLVLVPAWIPVLVPAWMPVLVPAWMPVLV